jgi:spore germination cell wall hydrolase CwlJ-like protein
MKVEALGQWRRMERRRRIVIIAALCAALMLAVIGAVLLLLLPQSGATPTGVIRKDATRMAISSSVRLNLPPPDLYRPITPEEAMKENAERAFSGRPDTPASPFKLDANASTREQALECLTQAVYYEAATEGADGQRAVAQIVLNRMRHPGYPASVCGVVYQGSERPTGCQFTFTCDGSLARLPVESFWKQARKIATEALGGKVFAPIGHATHYHADYVLPYWADSLDKSVQIGRHIFYRLKSGLGASGAFRQRYAGVEPKPLAPSTVEVTLEAVGDAGNLIGPIETSPLQVATGELIGSSEPKSQLAADASAGTLLIDGATSQATTSAKQTETPGCEQGRGGKHLRPLGANDVRAQSGKDSC